MNLTDRIPQPFSSLPWRGAQKPGVILCYNPNPPTDPVREMEEPESYTGNEIVAENLRLSDRDFVLAAVAPYNPLPDDLLERFVALEHRRHRLEADLDDTTKEIAGLQEPLQEQWGERGVSQVKMDGLTVHLKTTFYCSKAPGMATQTVCDALQKSGLGNMVVDGYAPSSLTAKMKELVATEDGDLPEALSGLLNYGELTKLATRRS